MERTEIFELINTERKNQDILWPRNERRKLMYSFTAPHLLLLEEKVSAMRTMWYKGEITPQELVKLATLAVRALEEITDEKFWEAKGAK